MKAASAIRTFFNSGPCLRNDLSYAPVSVMEIREFKKAMTPEEWRELASQACELFGTELE